MSDEIDPWEVLLRAQKVLAAYEERALTDQECVERLIWVLDRNNLNAELHRRGLYGEGGSPLRKARERSS